MLLRAAGIRECICRKLRTTSTSRMRKIICFAKKLLFAKAPFHKDAAVIRAKLNPMALYQCETCPVNESALESLRSSYVDLLTVASIRRSVDLTFPVASHGDDVDPDVDIPYRRAVAFRRGENRKNHTSKLLQENLDI